MDRHQVAALTGLIMGLQSLIEVAAKSKEPRDWTVALHRAVEVVETMKIYGVDD